MMIPNEKSNKGNLTLMVEKEYKEDGLDRARDLSAADNSMPEEAEASYRGPEALGQAGLRGTFFGYLGWKTGNWLGNLGAKPVMDSRYRNFKARNIGGVLGFVGAVMGVYGGLKDARFFRQQVDDLQSVVQKQNAKIGDLQGELKEQIKARNGSGRPKLTEYDASWDKGDASEEEKEAPRTEVSADEAEHEKPAGKELELA